MGGEAVMGRPRPQCGSQALTAGGSPLPRVPYQHDVLGDLSLQSRAEKQCSESKNLF